MSLLETSEKSSNHHQFGSESVGIKLLADAQNWFGHQSEKAKTLEIAAAAALGSVALGFAAKRLHTIEIVAKSTHLDGALTQLERQTAFAAKEYLDKPYIVSPALHEAMEKLSGQLAQKYPEFNSVVVVGGQSNGSYVLRSMTKDHPGSDLDFYLVGHATTPQNLRQMSNEVQAAVKPIKLTLDGVFNGKNPELYLNLDNLQHHIANEDYGIMAAPFRAAYGNPLAAQRAVLKAVIDHPRKIDVWHHIAQVHAETLSMHHGTWTLDFNNAIMHDYLPLKVEKFGLPDTPEEALRQLNKRSTDRP